MSCSRTTIEPPVVIEVQPHTIKTIDSLRWITTASHSFDDVWSFGFGSDGNILENISVEIGDSVAIGDTLAVLKHDLLSAKIRTQNAVISAAQRELDRITQLHSQQARTEVQREQAESVLLIERAKRSELIAEMKQFYLISSGNGVVIASLFRKGEFVSLGEPVVKIGGDRIIEFQFPLDFDTATVEVKVLDGSSFQTNFHSENGFARMEISEDLEYKLNNIETIQFNVPNSKNIARISMSGLFDINVGDVVKVTRRNDESLLLKVIKNVGNELTVHGDVSMISSDEKLKSVNVVRIK